jgi:hypothetical protein
VSLARSPRDDTFGNFLSRVHRKVASTSFEALTAARARLVQPNHLRLIRAFLIESGFCRGVRGPSVDKFFWTGQKRHRSQLFGGKAGKRRCLRDQMRA